MKKTTVILAALLALCSAGPVFGGDFSITGYVKNFSVAYETPTIKNAFPFMNRPISGSVSNRLRLNARWLPLSGITVDAAYDLVSLFKDFTIPTDIIVLSGSPTGNYRAFDLDTRLYPRQGDEVGYVTINHNLDRAMLSLRTSLADITVGRQPVAWGSARVISATDILAPFSYDALDTEDRVGVDAARVRVPLGFMGEIDAGYLFGKDFKHENSAFYFRGKYYLARTDFDIIVLGFRENLMLGFNLARALGGAGSWLEAAYVVPDALNDDDENSDDEYLRLTAGADYSFSDRLYGFCEYHYNQPGTGTAEEYYSRLSRTAYTDGGVYLLGEHYLMLGGTYQVTPLVILAGQTIGNLNDRSVLLVPSLEYNVAENIYLAAGAYIGLGRGPEFDLDAESPIVTRSEFGAYSDTFHMSFRVYF